MALWCRHNWELADKTFVPAPVELFQKAGGTKIDRTDQDFFITWLVLSWKCTKCGKFKIDKTSNRWMQT